MTECPHCHSKNLREGTFSNDDMAHGILFQPANVKFFTGWLRGTRCNDKVTACLDCGLVWTFTPAQELRQFLRKYSKQE